MLTVVNEKDGPRALLHVHLVPGAKRAGVAGVHGDSLKVAVVEPPERGRANRALLRLLAEALGVPRSAVEIVGGRATRRKRVRVSGVDAGTLSSRIEAVLSRVGRKGPKR